MMYVYAIVPRATARDCRNVICRQVGIDGYDCKRISLAVAKGKRSYRVDPKLLEIALKVTSR